jgi:hypothetical protein
VHLAPRFDAPKRPPLDDSQVTLETALGAPPPLENDSENILWISNTIAMASAASI